MKQIMTVAALLFAALSCTNPIAAQSNVVCDSSQQVKTVEAQKPIHCHSSCSDTAACAKKQCQCPDNRQTCKRDSSEQQIKNGLDKVGEGLNNFMKREAKAISKIAKKAGDSGKKVLKKVGKGVSNTLNKASDAVSSHQINH